MTNDNIEAYLIEGEYPFEQVGEGMWLINDDADFVDNIVLIHNKPVVTFRVKLMEAPRERRLELFTRLLELNATNLVAGAFGLEEDAIVIVDTLQSENLDYNEFQASVDSMALSIREHYQELQAYAQPQDEDLKAEA